MTTYYSTFSSGLSEVVRPALAQQIKDVKIDLTLDGLIVYESDRPLEQIKRIRFFNNTFLLLQQFNGMRGESIPYMMASILKKPGMIHFPRWAIKGSSFFRIMASKENQTVPIQRETLTRLESFFSHRLGLRVHRSKPDVEVWFLERSEGHGFVGIRLTHATAAEKNLQRGELRSELTHILCLISEPKKEDVFLDPFAGSGAIPIERARSFPYRQIIASDNDRETMRKLRNRLGELGLKVTLGEWNANNLKSISDHYVDKIVTDPPWGLFTSQDSIRLEKLYTDMLDEFSRVLKPGGIVVILMGQKEVFENSLKDKPDFRITDQYNILVSGKKAAIYKFVKHPER
jgi:23S rRNA G2445 N2-methylase RlmL